MMKFVEDYIAAIRLSAYICSATVARYRNLVASIRMPRIAEALCYLYASKPASSTRYDPKIGKLYRCSE